MSHFHRRFSMPFSQVIFTPKLSWQWRFGLEYCPLLQSKNRVRPILCWPLRVSTWNWHLLFLIMLHWWKEVTLVWPDSREWRSIILSQEEAANTLWTTGLPYPGLSDWYYLDKSNFFLWKKCIHLLSNRGKHKRPIQWSASMFDYIIFSKSGWTWLFFFHGFVWERDKSLHTHCIIGSNERIIVLEIHSSDWNDRKFKIPLGRYPKLKHSLRNVLWMGSDMLSEKLPSLMFFMTLYPTL